MFVTGTLLELHVLACMCGLVTAGLPNVESLKTRLLALEVLKAIVIGGRAGTAGGDVYPSEKNSSYNTEDFQYTPEHCYEVSTLPHLCIIECHILCLLLLLCVFSRRLSNQWRLMTKFAKAVKVVLISLCAWSLDWVVKGNVFLLPLVGICRLPHFLFLC